MQRGMSVWSLAVYFLFAIGVAWSQVSTGTISGMVSDATGAVVPGAEVVVRHTETGQSRTATTNERGRYVAPQLALGNYEVTARTEGFQTEIRRGITLAVGQEAVVNFALKVGAVSERVEVTGEAPLVETTTATTSGLVNEKMIQELPLNGRSFTDLMGTGPGVKLLAAAGVTGATNTRASYGFGAKFSVAGSHPDQNQYIVDGLIVNDTTVQTPSSAAGGLLGTDTIREFRMLTSNYSAEFGQVSGGVMTAVTKSGTNTLHGSVLEYLRNSALDARQFFDVGGVKPFKRNRFGFTLGGPVRKDHTFFFGSYEGLRERLATTGFLQVPSLATRRGVLPSGPCATGCTVGPTAQKVLNLFPLPNSTDHGDGTADYKVAPTNPTREDFFTVRLDHTFSQKHFLFGSYTFDQGSVKNPQTTGLYVATKENRYQHPVLNFTSLLTPTLLNTFFAGVNRARTFQASEQTADTSSLVHVPGRIPGAVNVTGLGNLSGAQDPILLWWTSYQYSDNLTYTRGTHSLKFGASLQRNQDNRNRAFVFGGTWTFSSIADFFAERPFNLNTTTQQSDAERGIRQWIIGTYIQDDWKALPNLTFNLGVRFEWVPVPIEVNNKIATVPHIFANTTTTVGGPFWKQRSAFAHAAPRVGLAWDPFGNGKTSVRGGFGIFQQAIRSDGYSNASDRMYPFYATTLLTNLPGALSPLG